MSVYVSMHRPVRALSGTFGESDDPKGSVSIFCADGHKVEIYTTPDMARAIADAVNTHATPEADA